jgi:N-acetylglucosaminyldiphosphoundecaprenol N-acetyl-beta-D-mannosaminyltransferase
MTITEPRNPIPAPAATAGTGHRCAIHRPDRDLLINGVRLDPLPPERLNERMSSFVDCGLGHVVHFLPAHPTVLARGDAAYREILNRGDLNLVDGASVALAARLYGHAAPRTTGSDALALLTGQGVESRSHYFYGAAPDVVSQLQRRLEVDNPCIEIVGAESPPFRDLRDEELVEAAMRIRRSGAQLLWIGIGTPKQDLVAERFRQLDAAPVILCVGAAFDFAAGSKRRAPAWMQSIGMEWLFRLLDEPGRLWRRYLIGNAQFVAGVVIDLVRPRSGG